MYSLDNSYSEEDMISWYERVQKSLGRTDLGLTCELKYDGVSISLIYEKGALKRALTRGDGVQGDNVIENIKTIRTVPLILRGEDVPKEVEVRGEIVLPLEGFKKMNSERLKNGEEPYMNPRNTASGSLKIQDSSLVAKRPLECLAYGLVQYAGNIVPTHWESLKTLCNWGFKVPKQATLSGDLDQVLDFIRKWEHKRDALPYEIDGVVIKVNVLNYQDELGHTAKSPRWAIAYKYKTDQAETVLESVSYQVGRTGAITPVANLKPVSLGGTIVKRASLHNSDQMGYLGMRLGDYVFVEKGGEIIPKIVGVNISKRKEENRLITYIAQCPVCNTPLEKRQGEAQHHCPNLYGCPAQITGKIQHFVSRKAMDIEGLGSEIVEQLYREGLISNSADLYRLEKEQLLELGGMAEKSASNLIEGIKNSKKVPFERLVYALGIRGFAYQPIIACGENTNVLHYLQNNRQCKDGDLILLDVAAEYANYSSDMTRTIPVSGRYSKRQKEVYKAVLKVKNEATELLFPGVLWSEYHREVGKIMTAELLKLGLLDKADVQNQNSETPAYKKYFMHGTSHHLGLDTHDYGQLKTPMKAQMVFTVEPGIYIPEEGFGIRLEDNVVIQEKGPPINLMQNIPIEADEIEYIMNT
ncbi:DNA ligase [Elysia marginata]|uniref:DNA ligase (NAD(+)) n=1 Tax=Elysia marginata TaxID=1093978 RepID=A0AAV4I0S9_9GAST|nr:DNA ligase [Elysia marginata]